MDLKTKITATNRQTNTQFLITLNSNLFILSINYLIRYRFVSHNYSNSLQRKSELHYLLSFFKGSKLKKRAAAFVEYGNVNFLLIYCVGRKSCEVELCFQ